jgi:hypothetical protein
MKIKYFSKKIASAVSRTCTFITLTGGSMLWKIFDLQKKLDVLFSESWLRFGVERNSDVPADLVYF